MRQFSRFTSYCLGVRYILFLVHVRADLLGSYAAKAVSWCATANWSLLRVTYGNIYNSVVEYEIYILHKWLAALTEYIELTLKCWLCLYFVSVLRRYTCLILSKECMDTNQWIWWWQTSEWRTWNSNMYFDTEHSDMGTLTNWSKTIWRLLKLWMSRCFSGVSELSESIMSSKCCNVNVRIWIMSTQIFSHLIIILPVKNH